MLGRVTAVSLVLLFLLIPAALPQCDFSLVKSAPFRSSVLDLAIDGNDLWVANAYGVQLFDRSVDPPVLVATVAVPSRTSIIRARGTVAYAGSGGRIFTIQKNGKSLQLVASTPAGGTVNDLVATPLSLYAATSNGVAQFDLLDPLAPVRTASTFATSSANATGLALSGSTLYAVDGDSSVEIFDVTLPALPQKIGTATSSLPRPASVKVTPTRVYVSDGQSSDVFFGSRAALTLSATVPYGTTSFAPLTGEVAMVAGSDRRLHALDWSTAASPVELFAYDLHPSGGTINRFSTFIGVGGARLYVAAGDAGLLSFDTASFTAPYPVHNFSFGGTTSLVTIGSKIYAGRQSTGLVEFALSSSGNLTQGRQWDARQQVVHDGSSNGFLLTSSGATLFYWTIASTIPSLVSSVTLAKPVKSAILGSDNLATALLDDGTLWSADMGLQTPSAQRVALGSFNPVAMARSGSGIALLDVRSSGTTALAWYPSGNFAATPQTVIVTGAATGGIGLSGSTAALFTFQGINVIDLTSGTVTLLPQSNGVVPKALKVVGSTVFELTDSALLLWDAAAKALTRQFPLPSEGSALFVPDPDSVGLAAVATMEGMASVLYRTPSRIPTVTAAAAGNAYYKRIAATVSRLYLFDGRTIDVFSTASGNTPAWVAGVRASGVIDLAASSAGLFTLSSNGSVTSYSRDGDLLRQGTVSDGTDVVPISITIVGGVPWVSISKGCLTGVCQKETEVLDPQSLVRTATLPGAVLDVTESGGRAYALTELPAAINVVNIADARHPFVIGSRAPEGSPVSIAYSGGTVYLLGDKVYGYAEEGLAKTGEQLAAVPVDGTTVYAEQRLRLAGGCAIVTARREAPLFFAVPAFSGAGTFAAPAAVRAVAQTPGHFYLLTDDSVEVLSNTAAPVPGRRRITH